MPHFYCGVHESLKATIPTQILDICEWMYCASCDGKVYVEIEGYKSTRLALEIENAKEMKSESLIVLCQRCLHAIQDEVGPELEYHSERPPMRRAMNKAILDIATGGIHGD